MGRLGYIFSLDAFVAFSIILLSVQALLVMSSAPAGYYRELAQASYLAHDTLEAMKIAKPPCNATSCPDQTYAERLSQYAYIPSKCQNDFACSRDMRELNDENILPAYSYAFVYDHLDGSAPSMIYNASADSLSKHYNISYKRVQASAQTVFLGYSTDMQRGDSPFCNVVCRGYDPDLFGGTGGITGAPACDKVPCGDPVQSNFRPGTYNVGMIRMLVWG